MSDKRISEARNLATSEPTLENLLRLEHILEASGEKAEECFYEILDAYTKAVKDAKEIHDIFCMTRDEESRLEYQKQYGPSMVCSRCKGTGWLNSDYPCGCTAEKIFQPDWRKLDSIVRATKVPGLQEAHENLIRLKDERRKRSNATEISVGALVQYINPKARAKFKETDEKVELFTIGLIRWLGEHEGYRSRYGSWSQGSSQRVGIASHDGFFYTYVKNLDQKALNAWTRYRGFDAHSKALQTSADAREHAEKILEKRFGYKTLTRRQTVRINGTVCTIMWVGYDKKTGTPRVGFKIGRRPNRQQEMIWADALECEPV